MDEWQAQGLPLYSGLLEWSREGAVGSLVL